MGKLFSKYQLHKRWILPVIGVLAVAILLLPYVLLGQGSYVQVHDQVDGEILNYIYRAKYFLKGNTIPEFMNGMDKASMTPPAPFGVLLYIMFPPYAAFVVMQSFVMLVGFLGMYFLCKKFGIVEEISLVVAVLFAMMPFYPTYGLAALGQPLLILCFYELVVGKRRLLPFLGIILYAGFSSLVLVGYVWVCVGLVAGIVLKLRKRNVKYYFLGWGMLMLTYIATNLDLFKVFSSGGFTTHREEMVIRATTDLWGEFIELFFAGGSYSKVYSLAVFAVAVVCLIVGGVCAFGKKYGKVVSGNAVVGEYWKAAMCLLLVIVILTTCAVLWGCGPIVELRKTLGGFFVYFQADRVYWTFPFLWMMLLALLLHIIFCFAKENQFWVKGVLAAFCLLLLAVEGYQIFRDSNFNKNIRLLLFDNYEQVTWRSIYMEDVFDEVEEVLDKDKEQYRVVSLGLYPSIALYNGFYCADGYSNNYDLEYKHAFRQIQAVELEKNDEVRVYLDEWGNRLYLASAEYGVNGMISKSQGIAFRNLSYDTEMMKRLNIRYVFAAAPIEDVEDLGWQLVKGSPFESDDSYYALWIYDIGQ